MADDAKRKIVKISSQMQVRIPRDLYERYGFTNEAELVPTGEGIELRPVKSTAQRCTELLESLVSEGLSGDELVERFREESASITEAEGGTQYAFTKLSSRSGEEGA